MKTGLIFAIALLTIASANAAEPNTLTQEDRAAGWQLLFDGKTTAGWHSYGKSKVKKQWQVVDGALTLIRGGGRDLVTDAKYTSFELSFEWRISEKGNSGVMYRVDERMDYPWRTGPEYQVLDNAHRPEGPLEQAGALFALYAPAIDVTRPTGEWNAARLVIDGAHVEHWLNGAKVVAYDLWSDEFKARVAGSKFASMPDFARRESGAIVFQDHGDPVAYRSIKIRPLPGR